VKWSKALEVTPFMVNRSVQCVHLATPSFRILIYAQSADPLLQ